MERVALLGVAGAVVLIPPVRNRVVPVTKAVGRTGIAMVGTVLTGARGVLDAAWRGEPALAKVESAGRGTSTRKAS